MNALSKLRTATSLVVVALSGLALSTPTTAIASDPLAVPPECNMGSTIDLEQVDALKDVSCDFTNVTVSLPDGTDYAIPEAGMGVFRSAFLDEDSSVVTEGDEDVVVAHSIDGNLAVEIDGSKFGNTEVLRQIDTQQFTPTAIQPLAASSGKCGTANRYSYSASGNFWSGKAYNWYFKDVDTPSTNSLARIRNAMGTWKEGELCQTGTSVSNSLSTSYLGLTTADSDVTSSGGCSSSESPDKNVVVFNTINQSGTLAVTCRTYVISTGNITSADIKFDSEHSWFSGSDISACSEKYDVRGVALHEIGHAVGLDHVATSTNQVMQPTTAKCDTSQRNLGIGDAYGMRALYYGS